MSPDGSWVGKFSEEGIELSVAADGSWVMKKEGQGTINVAADGSWVRKGNDGTTFTTKTDGTWVYTDAAGNTGTSEDGKAKVTIPKRPDMSAIKPSKDATTPKTPVQPKKVNSNS